MLRRWREVLEGERKLSADLAYRLDPMAIYI